MTTELVAPTRASRRCSPRPRGSPARACRSRSSRRTCSASASRCSPTARTRCATSCSAPTRYGDRDCYVFGDGSRIRFDELVPQVASLACALRDRHGIGPGDRVAVCAANCREWLMTFWAVASLDAVLVAMNGWWTGAEMRNALDLTDPKLLVMDEKRRARLDGDPGAPAAARPSATSPGSSTTRRPSLPDVPIAEDDPFILIFTSGTTGRPKAAVLSHRSVISYLMEQSFIAARGMAMAGIDRRRPSGPPHGAPRAVPAVPRVGHVDGGVDGDVGQPDGVAARPLRPRRRDRAHPARSTSRCGAAAPRTSCACCSTPTSRPSTRRRSPASASAAPPPRPT